MAKRSRKRTPKRRGTGVQPPASAGGTPPAGSSARQHGNHGRRAKPVPPARKSPPAKTISEGKSTALAEAAAPLLATNLAHPPLRIGHGYDLHRLEPLAPAGAGRAFVLGGIQIDPAGAFGKGPVAHSDGDVLLHAITDALLGALGLQDIGQLFPDNLAENEGRNSAEFVAAALQKVLVSGYVIANIDCTVILEKPKLLPFKVRMRERLASMLHLSVEQINLKGKTHEKVDAVGEGRAIEAHVVALLLRIN